MMWMLVMCLTVELIIREGYIKMDLQEVGWGGMDWFSLAEDRDRWWSLVNAVMNILVP
jgi:hypothetical protein